MNNEILDKIDEIIKVIENSPEYQKYLLLKNEIKKNKELCSLINEVRVLQKDVTHGMDKKLELKNKTNTLNSYPLYIEYNNILYEINNNLSIIETSINNYFQKKLN